MTRTHGSEGAGRRQRRPATRLRPRGRGRPQGPGRLRRVHPAVGLRVRPAADARRLAVGRRGPPLPAGRAERRRRRGAAPARHRLLARPVRAIPAAQLHAGAVPGVRGEGRAGTSCSTPTRWPCRASGRRSTPTPAPTRRGGRRRAGGTTCRTLCGTFAERGGGVTQLPVALVERPLLTCTDPGDLVLDPFGGEGTTGVAAVRHGRRCVLVERDRRRASAARGVSPRPRGPRAGRRASAAPPSGSPAIPRP